MTLPTSGVTRSCTKTEKYRKRVCSFDPIAGQQCWYENRTRTLTKGVIQSCPSGYSPDGTGCTADTASTRWKLTRNTPTKYRYEAATKSCIRGYSDNGTQCEADTASQRWVRTASTPTRYRYEAATKSCIRGYSDNGTQCEADTASQRWVATGSTPTKYRHDPATKSCPSGYSDNNTQCQADTASTRWDPTGSAPVTSRTVSAVRSCETDFAWNGTSAKCEKTVYSDPTAPLTKLVGDTPTVSCQEGYDPAGGGQCSRTVLGEPTQAPIGAECIDHLGTLGAATVSRTGTLAAGCVSLRKGDAQSPHYARRYTLSVTSASTATFTASSSAADVYLYVLSSSAGSITVEDSDDDSGTDTDAQVTGVALAAGVTYTIEVTTSAAGTSGAFTLAGTITPDEPPVVITGLADAAVTGSGTVTASDAFTVEPANATCTATAAAVGVTPSVAKTPTPGERTVSLTLAAPFSHDVTVVCDAAGRSPTSAKATLAGRLPEVSVTDFEDTTARVASRGLRYATDKITVDPADASCSVRTAGRGVNRPWVSDRGPRRIVLAYLLRGGAATVTVTCTATGYSPGVARALFSDEPRPQIGTVAAALAPSDACTTTTAAQDVDAAHRCTLAEGATLTATLTATADHATIAARWSTTGGATATPASVPAATPVIGPDNAATGDWQTTATAALACTAHGTATATVTAGRHPATDTHTTHIDIDCEQRVHITGLDNTTQTGTGTVTATDTFTVEPATADCTAAPTGTITAPDPRRPQERLLSAQVRVGTTTTITVTCTNNNRADGVAKAVLSGVAADCGDPLGSLVHGTTTRDGTVAADAGCTSAGRGVGGTFYARRHTFTLDAAARVSVDLAGAASDAGRLDVYAVVYRGRDAVAGAVVGRDDNSGPRSDSRLRSLRLGAGEYTIEATTAAAEAVGGYQLRVRAVYRSAVRISGLADAAGAGTGAVTVSEPFTVSPSTAECTAAPAAASVAAGRGRRRTVSAALDGPGSLPVTVTCTAAGRGPARQQAVLTHAGALTSIAARTASSGGECKTAAARRGVDVAYRCKVGRGNTVTVAADAVATGPGVAVAWATTGAVTATGHQTGAATPAFGPDNSIAAWKRTATVDLACTANGTATAKATLAGTTAKKTARLTVVCANAVRIDGLADTSAEGSGTVTVTRGFTVTPSSADCAADPAAATVTEGVGGARTLSAPVAVPATLEVTVTCKAAGYADAVRRVALTARRPCSTHLGTLATGTVTRSGSIADDGCVAKARRRATESVFYASAAPHWAKRHTFALDTPGWVTISLDSAAANAEALDTYLVLLKDDANKGTPIERNDNRTRRDSNARLAGIFLQPGRYTIEATTKTPQTAGGYSLRVDATVTGLKASYSAVVGRELRIDFDLGNHQAKVTASHTDLGVKAHRTGTVGTLRLTAGSINTRTVTVVFSRPMLGSRGGPVGTRAANGGETSQPTGDEYAFQVYSGCDPARGLKPGPLPLGLCVWDYEKLFELKNGPSYEVTPALLDGARRVAAIAVAERRHCGMTAGQLAGWMIAIGFREIIVEAKDNPVDRKHYELRANKRDPARSLMTLSRTDRPGKAYPGDSRIRTRAFWHPGVGYWQLDYWPLSMGHAERADIDKGGLRVARELLDGYCNGRTAGLTSRYKLYWAACNKATDPCRKTYNNIYLGQVPFIRFEGLYVSTANNLAHTDADGGVQLMGAGAKPGTKSCRWGPSGTPFNCWLYDTDNPEGYIDCVPEHADPDYRCPAGDDLMGSSAKSPLAAPFLSFNADIDVATNGQKLRVTRRFAVFPASFTGDTATWVKQVPYDNDNDNSNDRWSRVRTASTGNKWTRNTLEGTTGGKVLQVFICPPHGVAPPDTLVCRWVDTTDANFKTKLRARYP